MKNKKRIWLLLLINLLNFSFLYAQRDFQIISSSVIISGTSTFHDWQARTENVSGTATLNLQTNELDEIAALKVWIAANSIKSDQGEWMDKNIYKALKTNVYPEISFNLIKAQAISSKKKEIKLKAVGELTIAGTTKKILLNGTGISNQNKFKISVSKNISMESFNIDAPSHLLGTVKAGDMVEIHFEVTFANSGICSLEGSAKY